MVTAHTTAISGRYGCREVNAAAKRQPKDANQSKPSACRFMFAQPHYAPTTRQLQRQTVEIRVFLYHLSLGAPCRAIQDGLYSEPMPCPQPRQAGHKGRQRFRTARHASNILPAAKSQQKGLSRITPARASLPKLRLRSMEYCAQPKHRRAEFICPDAFSGTPATDPAPVSRPRHCRPPGHRS